jgi:hypothetical protein
MTRRRPQCPNAATGGGTSYVLSVRYVLDATSSTVRVLVAADGLVGVSDQAPATVLIDEVSATNSLVIDAEG